MWLTETLLARPSAQALAFIYMNEETDIRKTLLTKGNILLLAGVYLFVSIYCSFSIFSESNLALPDLSDKIYTLLFVLLVFI